MEVVDAHVRDAIDSARSEARSALGWTVFVAGLLLLALTAQLRGAMPDPWGWIVVGLVAGEVWATSSAAVRGWWEARQVARCSMCRAAAVAAGRALDDWEACARSKHTPAEGEAS